MTAKGCGMILLTMDSPTGSWWFIDNTLGGLAIFSQGYTLPINIFPSISNLVKLVLCSDHCSSRLYQPRVLNKDPTVWLDGVDHPLSVLTSNPTHLEDWLIFCQGLHPMYMMDSSTKIHFQVYKNINWSFAQIIFLVRFASQGFLNCEPTIWLDGAGPPSKYVNIHSDNNSGSGVLAHFSLGIHPMYTVSSTKNTFPSI